MELSREIDSPGTHWTIRLANAVSNTMREPGSNKEEEEDQQQRLCSDLHTCVLVCTHLCTHAQTHTYIQTHTHTERLNEDVAVAVLQASLVKF